MWSKMCITTWLKSRSKMAVFSAKTRLAVKRTQSYISSEYMTLLSFPQHSMWVHVCVFVCVSHAHTVLLNSIYKNH